MINTDRMRFESRGEIADGLYAWRYQDGSVEIGHPRFPCSSKRMPSDYKPFVLTPHQAELLHQIITDGSLLADSKHRDTEALCRKTTKGTVPPTPSGRALSHRHD